MLAMSYTLNRRNFIIAGGMTALAATRVVGANDTLRVGIIGAGGRMNDLMRAADQVGGYQIVAVSDVYAPRRDAVKQRPNVTAATTHANYKEVLDLQLDAVLIASPDHWHVRMATEALASGKDVYLEKPVTHTIEEGATLTHAVRSSKFCNAAMQQRSWSHFRDAVDLIQGGSLGRVPQVRTYWWQLFPRTAHAVVDTQGSTGSTARGAPDQPFREEKFFRWRWFWNFGGGAMTDLFTHWIDVAHWAMKSGTEPCVAPDACALRVSFEQWDCPDTVQAALRYPGFDVVYEGMMGSSIDDGGLEPAAAPTPRSKSPAPASPSTAKACPTKTIPSSKPTASATAPSRTWKISSRPCAAAKSPTLPPKPEEAGRLAPVTSPTLPTTRVAKSRGPRKPSLDSAIPLSKMKLFYPRSCGDRR